MKRELIIVLTVFKTLVQSSSINTSSFYDLSTDQSSVFYQLREYQVSTNAERFAAYDLFFQLFQNLATKKLIDNEKPKFENTTTLVQTAVSHEVTAMVFAGHALYTALGKTCEDTILVKYVSYISDIMTRIGNATELAVSGDIAGNRDALNKLHLDAQDVSNAMIKMIYDGVRSCINTTEIGILAMVKTSEDICYNSSLASVNAAFNAATYILDANSAKSGNDVTLLTAIRSKKRDVMNGLKEIAVSEYSLFQAIYLQYQKNVTTALGPDLFSIQHTWLVSYDKYKMATESIFDVIKYLSNGTDFVEFTTAQDYTSSCYEEGLRVLVESVEETSSHDATIAAASVWVYFGTYANKSSASFYDAMALTQGGSTTAEIQEKIETMEEEGLAEIRTFVRKIVELIRNGRTWGKDVEAKITSIVEEMASYVKSYVVAVYSAIQLLNSGDLDGIDTFWSEADSAIYASTYHISNLRYTILRADYLIQSDVSKSRICTNFP